MHTRLPLVCLLPLAVGACSPKVAPTAGPDGLPLVIDLNAADAPPLTAADSARVLTERRERSHYDSLRVLAPSSLSERDVLWMQLYDARQRTEALEAEARLNRVRDAQRDRAQHSAEGSYTALVMAGLVGLVGAALVLFAL